MPNRFNITIKFHGKNRWINYFQIKWDGKYNCRIILSVWHRCNCYQRCCPRCWNNGNTWWRHQMETFSPLLAICAGNSPVTGDFPAQRPVTRSFDVFVDLHLNKRLSKEARITLMKNDDAISGLWAISSPTYHWIPCSRCRDRLITRLILGFRPANERRRYKVTSSLIGWAQT